MAGREDEVKLKSRAGVTQGPRGSWLGPFRIPRETLVAGSVAHVFGLLPADINLLPPAKTHTLVRALSARAVPPRRPGRPVRVSAAERPGLAGRVPTCRWRRRAAEWDSSCQS